MHNITYQKSRKTLTEKFSQATHNRPSHNLDKLTYEEALHTPFKIVKNWTMQ